MTAAVTLGFLAVTTFLWYHVMTGLNTDHLLSGESADQTVEIGIKNNLEMKTYMDEVHIPANKLFTSWIATFLSAVLKVALVLFPNFLCK